MKNIGAWLGDPSPTPIAEKRGIIGSLCSNDWLIFVKADVESVVKGLKDIRNDSLWKRDIYGQTITLGVRPCCYVLQLKGHTWTFVQYIPMGLQGQWSIRPSIRMAFNREDALALSRILETESVFLEYSSTGGYLKYFYYSLGAMVESLDYIDSRGSKEGYYEFESQICDLYSHIEPYEASLIAKRFFLSRDILVFEVIWPSLDGHTPGEEIRFSFTEISEEDVKRADYLEF